MTTTQRIKCPTCGRRTAQLACKVDGRYVGYTRRDGSAIYLCSWGNCTMADFTLHADGRVTNRHTKVPHE